MEKLLIRAQAKAKAFEVREKFNIDAKEKVDVTNLIENLSNFTLIYMPFDDKFEGYSSKHKNHYVIVVNSNSNNHKRNFTIAHELYHLLCEYDENDNYCPNEYSENSADYFASFFLISDEAFMLHLQKNGLLNKTIAIEEVIELENYFNVSRMAILIRLRDEGLITKRQFEDYNKNILKSVKNIGGNTKNYINPEEPETIVKGEYVELAKKLLKQNKITLGKFRELMMESYNFKELFKDEEDG